MARVSWRAVAAVLEAARLANLSPGPLVEGLSFTPSSLRDARWVGWDEYCTLIERFEARCGGPEAVEHFLADHLIYSELHAIAGAFVSPVLLYRFIFRIADPMVFPCVDFHYEERRDGRLRIACRLQPRARACPAFFRGSAGAMRAVPLYLGLPPAAVDADVGERAGVYLVTPPESRTLAARARRRARHRLDGLLAVMQEMVGEAEPRRMTPRPASAEDTEARLRRVAGRHGLTPRQTQVLDGIVAGLSNKEIAARHGCAENTIELHVTNLFRKLSVQSRTQLVARFWSLP